MDITSYLLGKNASGGGGGGLDWSAIGYDSTPKSVVYDYNYAKEIYDNWTPATDLSSKFQNNKTIVFMPLVDTSIATTMTNMFDNCSNLTSVPLLDTSNVTNMNFMFLSCYNLVSIEKFDTSKVTTMRQMFSGCSKLTTIPKFDTSSLNGSLSFFNIFSSDTINLSNESLNNILQMCIGATSYTGTKTLYQLGFRSTNYPVSRIEALPSYQDFIDAGWTIGY